MSTIILSVGSILCVIQVVICYQRITWWWWWFWPSGRLRRHLPRPQSLNTGARGDGVHHRVLRCACHSDGQQRTGPGRSVETPATVKVSDQRFRCITHAHSPVIIIIIIIIILSYSFSCSFSHSSVAASRLWNTLPQNVMSAPWRLIVTRTRPKTHLFNHSFTTPQSVMLVLGLGLCLSTKMKYFDLHLWLWYL